MSHSFRSLASVFGTAFMTLLGIEAYLHVSCRPPMHLDEVDDGIAALSAADPDTLLVGSSHARSFNGVARDVSTQAGHVSMVNVPVENGRWSSYAWVIEHRVRPVLAALESIGHHRLTRFILLTDTWDACGTGAPEWNLPSRAWQLRDFAKDFSTHGMTDYNRNYVRHETERLLQFSFLLNDRGKGQLVPNVLSKLGITGQRAIDDGSRLRDWQRDFESHWRDPRCHDLEAVKSLQYILQWAKERGLETWIVTFPRKPATSTELGIRSTRKPFMQFIQATANHWGARVIDLASTYPIADEDFLPDWDHLTAEGNTKFSKWTLSHEMAFLREAPKR